MGGGVFGGEGLAAVVGGAVALILDVFRLGGRS